MLGFFSFGVGMRESGERFLFLWVSATPPARPTSATPPAIAGPLAFSRTVPTFDLLCAGLDLLCAGLERRLEVCDDRLRAGLRDRELEPVFLVEPVERLLVVDLFEPLRLRCELAFAELAFAELLFEPVVFLVPTTSSSPSTMNVTCSRSWSAPWCGLLQGLGSPLLRGPRSDYPGPEPTIGERLRIACKATGPTGRPGPLGPVGPPGG